MHLKEEFRLLIKHIYELEEMSITLKAQSTYNGRGEGFRAEFIAWSGLRKAILGMESLIREKAKKEDFDELMIAPEVRKKYREIINKTPSPSLPRKR